MDKKLGFSGTLDPITLGHVWVIEEARQICDKVLIFISENPTKKPSSTAEERKAVVEAVGKERGWTDVEVVIVKSDYTARAAKRLGVTRLIRGIRTTADFDYENLIQQANVEVLSGVKTIFVMPPRDLGAVSSSFVRAIAGGSPVGWHNNVRRFVPFAAYEAIRMKWLKDQFSSTWGDLKSSDEEKFELWFAKLIGPNCYGSEERCYHGLNHLVHGLSEIDVWAANTGRPILSNDVRVVKKAFWFHDSIYGHQINGETAEMASANLWSEFDDPEHGKEVRDLILATDHFETNSISHPLKEVMLGVDLAILGQGLDDPSPEYDEYAKAIRAEYPNVSDEVYCTERSKALSHLLNEAKAGRLFKDAYFSGLYNDVAIRNMQNEINNLGHGSPAPAMLPNT